MGSGLFPAWIGTLPAWGTFFMVLAAITVAVVRIWPRLKELGITERQGIAQNYINRIIELRAEVKECRDNCDAQEARLRKEIDDNRKECDAREEQLKQEVDRLKMKINNEAWQRVQSEISLVNTLIQVVDAPELRVILEALRQRSALLPAEITEIGGPVEDVRGNK